MMISPVRRWTALIRSSLSAVPIWRAVTPSHHGQPTDVVLVHCAKRHLDAVIGAHSFQFPVRPEAIGPHRSRHTELLEPAMEAVRAGCYGSFQRLACLGEVGLGPLSLPVVQTAGSDGSRSGNGEWHGHNTRRDRHRPARGWGVRLRR